MRPPRRHRHRDGGRRPRPALPRRVLRRRHHLRGDGAHPRRQGRARRDGPVLKPGGRIAITVPRYGPEKVCWALSDAYHEVEGGHIRIYRADELLAKIREAGLKPYGTHHAHALHSPYWWLKCAFGVDNDKALPVRAYHKLLVWDIMKKPLATRVAEQALNPLIGKSFVAYATKPHLPKIAEKTGADAT